MGVGLVDCDVHVVHEGEGEVVGGGNNSYEASSCCQGVIDGYGEIYALVGVVDGKTAHGDQDLRGCWKSEIVRLIEDVRRTRDWLKQ